MRQTLDCLAYIVEIFFISEISKFLYFHYFILFFYISKLVRLRFRIVLVFLGIFDINYLDFKIGISKYISFRGWHQKLSWCYLVSISLNFIQFGLTKLINYEKTSFALWAQLRAVGILSRVSKSSYTAGAAVNASKNVINHLWLNISKRTGLTFARALWNRRITATILTVQLHNTYNVLLYPEKIEQSNDGHNNILVTAGVGHRFTDEPHFGLRFAIELYQNNGIIKATSNAEHLLKKSPFTEEG